MEPWYSKLLKQNKSTAEFGHSDILSVHKSSLSQMPNSKENMNIFWSDSNTMVPKWNYVVFFCRKTIQDGRQDHYLKYLNPKMTITQEPLVEIDPNVCQTVCYMKLFGFFE